MSSKTKSLGLIAPTAAEDAAITAGIAADPDTVEITPELAATMKRGRGRPALEHTKRQVSMRLDEDVLQALEGSGRGWRTRVNDVLRRAVEAGEFAGH